MARGKARSDEEKAAVLSALLAGQSANAVAREFKLAASTVREWKRTLPDLLKEQVRATSSEVRAENEVARRESFNDLVGNYLRELLTTLQVQAAYFRERSFLEKQSGADLAVNHGVLADKGFRILAAAESDPGPDAGSGAPASNL